MLEALVDFWPFLLLIAVFIGFSVYMARTMGSGSGGANYITLMQAQVRLMEKQAETQQEIAADIRRQTEALERIAKAAEPREG